MGTAGIPMRLVTRGNSTLNATSLNGNCPHDFASGDQLCSLVWADVNRLVNMIYRAIDLV